MKLSKQIGLEGISDTKESALTRLHNKKITTSDNHTIELHIDNSHGESANAIVLITHGIFADIHERGRLDKLSTLLCANNFTTVRFNFRGHGDSHLDFRHFSISGAVIDYWTVLRELRNMTELPIIAIGSSFGGSIVLLCEFFNSIPIQSFVLINPVVDYLATFIKPHLKWAKEIFTDSAKQDAQNTGMGVLGALENKLNITDKLLFELNVYKPYEAIDLINNSPLLLLHGTDDDKVPIESAVMYCSNKDNVKLDIIDGGTHGFKSDFHQNLVYQKILDWIKNS